jgi:hypothetical protein
MPKGGLSNKELSKVVKESYKKKKDVKNIGDYVLDKELSNSKSKVFNDPKTGKTIVAHSGTHGTFADWSNNPSIITGNYKDTKRYKTQEKITRKSNAKYGQENITNVTHSQSSEGARIMAKKGLTSKSIALNPAITKSHKGVQVVRSSGDLVSALTPKEKGDKTIKNKTYNPLLEHGTSILSREPQEYGGYGMYSHH